VWKQTSFSDQLFCYAANSKLQLWLHSPARSLPSKTYSLSDEINTTITTAINAKQPLCFISSEHEIKVERFYYHNTHSLCFCLVHLWKLCQKKVWVVGYFLFNWCWNKMLITSTHTVMGCVDKGRREVQNSKTTTFTYNKQSRGFKQAEGTLMWYT